MKKYKVYYHYPDNPLPIRKICWISSKGLQNKMEKNFKFVLPAGNEISDIEVYLLDYLNSALELLKNCDGFHKHVAEYKNDPESAFFVTVIADVLVGHGLKVKLEPDVPLQNKKPDIYAFQSPDGLGVFFECKRPKEDTKRICFLNRGRCLMG